MERIADDGSEQASLVGVHGIETDPLTLAKFGSFLRVCNLLGDQDGVE
ncbi:MAG: hypothetical protein ACJ8FY_03280 [Gemmataceae bacterium]